MMTMKKVAAILFAVIAVFVTASCKHKDELSLWADDAPAKKALVEYMETVTKNDSADFIPVEDRVAVFDFDGTLFLETDPTYFTWLLFEHRVLDDSRYTPTKEQLAAALAARDKGVYPAYTEDRERMVAEAYAGMTLDEFSAFVRAFMKEDADGFFGLKRGDAYYKPMVQVVDYLIKNDFTVYVVSGTDRYIVRPLVMDGLGLQPRQIIGSDNTIVAREQGDSDGLLYTFTASDELVLGSKHILKNLQMNKVAAIVKEIGVQPVLAFGNSSTDASMLNYTIANNKFKALAFAVCCDDLEREYGNTAAAEKMCADSAFYGWIPISMRDDWKTIFGDGVERR